MQGLKATMLVIASFLRLTSTSSPNIVLILTDDQDVTLGGLTPLKKTKELIADAGITFVNAFATTPICCPSRSSILTGLYLHSHGTVNNSVYGGCSNDRWQKNHEPKTFGAVLREAGYRTFYAGKYLNRYGYDDAGGVKHVPTGWDWWIGLVGNSVYYNYTLSINGSRLHKGDKVSDYLTDVLKEYSLDFLKMSDPNPFLMVISPPSPHEPFTPAKRHEGRFSGLKAPRTPSFNLPVKKTKHWLLRLPPDVLPQRTINKIDEVFRDRWETLLAVDELVEAIVSRLQELDLLNNTFIIFTSDNGFHLGQFGLPWDKRQPYETDIRVPLLVRGPGLQKRIIKYPVLNIDLAPTILHVAGIPSDNFSDGKSFLPLVNSVSEEKKGRSFLVEYRGEGEKKSARKDCYEDPNVKLCTSASSCKCFDARNNTFDCIRRLSRKEDYVFCQFRDDESFEEFYDLRKDPHQINNLEKYENTSAKKRTLHCCRKMIQMKISVDECFHL